MNISSLLDIVGGELENSPSISSIYNIKLNPKKVTEGDLYIAKSSDNLQIAVKNGAFAIIHDFETSVLDKEIAWIKVDSSYNALLKILRFKLSPFNIKVFYCNSFTLELLKIYKSNNKNIKILTSKSDDILRAIEDITSSDIIFSNDLELLKVIYPKFSIFDNKNYVIKNLIEHSLFETSFSYENFFFNKLKLPSIYTNEFINVFNFFDKSLDLKKISKTKQFNPIFVDKFLNILDYGKSSKFLVVQNNPDLYEKELNFFLEKYKYGKTLFISKDFVPNLLVTRVKKLKEIRNILQNSDFNAVYIMGFESKRVERFFELCSIQKNNLF